MATSVAPAINHDSMPGSGDAQVVEVAEMLDTLAAADVQLTISELDELRARGAARTASPGARGATAVERRRPGDTAGAVASRRRMLGEGR